MYISGITQQQVIKEAMFSAYEGIQKASSLDAGINIFGQLDAGDFYKTFERPDISFAPLDQSYFFSAPAAQLEPAPYLDEVAKAGIDAGIDATAVKEQLLNPQLDVTAQLQEVAALPVKEIAIRPEALQVATAAEATEVAALPVQEIAIRPDMLQVATSAEATEAAGGGGDLVGAFGKNIDTIDALQEELMGLDMSTPEGQKRAFEIQQDLQELMTMQNLILNLISMENDLKQRIIDTMRA